MNQWRISQNYTNLYVCSCLIVLEVVRSATVHSGRESFIIIFGELCGRVEGKVRKITKNNIGALSNQSFTKLLFNQELNRSL